MTVMARLPLFIPALLLALSPPAFVRGGSPSVPHITKYQTCFAYAGTRYHIDPLLLEAIGIQESGLNPLAINRRNRDGSADYGLMQINSRHLPGLTKEGLIRRERDLLEKPCLSIQIAARLLARHFQTCGVNWNCLGSYNAGFAKRNHRVREKYADLIWSRYRRLLQERCGVSL
ncbi:TPA: lytic transglycosylase domain-containing protein [Klebsiella oxytoca]|nr:lytic transglycosylase domain-containing protein [Klebsiella oxytoca]